MEEMQLKRYFDAFTDCWKFFKKWSGEKSDDDWKQLLLEAEELRKKDEDFVFRKTLISETILELNRLSKEKK